MKYIITVCLYITICINSLSKDFETFSTDVTGLPSTRITCLFKDHEGFIWIGTKNGLYRYDGYNAIHYSHSPRNNHSLSNNSITCMQEDANHQLWIGTEFGLNRFDKYTQSFTRYLFEKDTSQSLSGNHILSILQKDDELWTVNRSLLAYYSQSKKEFSTYNFKHGDIKDAIMDNQNPIIWIASYKGLFSFNINEKNLEKFHHPQYNNFSPISLTQTSDGMIWLGSAFLKIYKYNSKEDSLILLKDNNILKRLKDNEYPKVLETDHKDNIWCGTNKGYFVFGSDNQELKHYKQSGFIHFIYRDYENIIWLCRNFNQLFIHDPHIDKFSKYHVKLGENSQYEDYITSIVEIGNYKWLSSVDGGLIKLDSNNHFIKRYTACNQKYCLSNNKIMDLAYDGDKYLWIASRDGLNKMDVNTGNIIKTLNPTPSIKHGIKSNIIRILYIDKKNLLWIIDNEGISILNMQNDQFIENTITTRSKKIDQITDLFQDEEGNYWFASPYGLMKYCNETSSIQHYYFNVGEPKTIGSNLIHNISQDKEGQIWVATGNGLSLFDKQSNSFINYRSTNGYNDFLDLHAIGKEIWLLNPRGISVFHKKTRTFNHYSTVNGIGDNYFRLHKSGDNHLYLSGSRGFYYFHPDSISHRSKETRVKITELAIMGNRVPIGSEILPYPIHLMNGIEINYNHKTISFSLSTLNFINPEKDEFAYKLEGYDTSWHYLGNTRAFALMNLKPGNYSLKIMARNNGPWGEPSKNLTLTVNPPWWHTPLAYTIYVLILISILYIYKLWVSYKERLKYEIIVQRLKSQQLHELDQTKLRFFMNVSHEFRTPLTVILGSLNDILTNRLNPSKDIIASAFRNAKRLQDLIDQLLQLRKLDVGYIKPSFIRDNFAKNVENIAVPFISLANQKKIQFSYHVNIKDNDCWIDKDKLNTIVSNLLSNAFKFTDEGGKVTLIITEPSTNFNLVFKEFRKKGFVSVGEPSITNRFLVIDVTDNGKGMERKVLARIFDRFYSSSGTGIGLALIKELIFLLGGNILVKSNPSWGSSFVVLLPVEPNNYEDIDVALPKSPKEGNKILPETTSIDDEEFIKEQEALKSSASIHRNSILIIEDNLDLLDYIQKILSPIFKTFSATNGKMGLEKARKHNPSIILSDIMMPEMDGFELCRILKNDENISHIPIILLTAKQTPESEEVGFKQGADDYIVKPFDSRVLLARINNQFEIRKSVWEKFLSDTESIPSKDILSSNDESFMIRASEIIEENISNPDFNQHDLFKALGKSRSFVYKKLYALTSQSVNEFINMVRIKKAANILKSDKKINISDLAYSLGFTDPGYFTKLFKKHFKETPTGYNNRYIRNRMG